MSNRIATAALTGRIYMGRVNKADTDFVGQTTDVTSDVMKAIIDKAEHHGDGGFEIVSGDQRWTVNVTKRATTDKTPTADNVPEDAARLTSEQEYAIRQGHEIAASDGYFDARPQIESKDRRKVFQAGFERGWDAARKQGANHD